MAKKSERAQAYFSPAQMEALEFDAKRNGRTISQHIAFICCNYLQGHGYNIADDIPSLQTPKESQNNGKAIAEKVPLWKYADDFMKSSSGKVRSL